MDKIPSLLLPPPPPFLPFLALASPLGEKKNQQWWSHIASRGALLLDAYSGNTAIISTQSTIFFPCCIF